MEDWVKACDPMPLRKADITKSGSSNAGMTIGWLKEVFDPATWDQAAGSPCLLLLDGPVDHTSIEFIKA